jgi:hypothetical protein
VGVGIVGWPLHRSDMVPAVEVSGALVFHDCTVAPVL